MARKEKTVVITAQNRDAGKHFLLTEMPARQGEAWGMRALLALARGGVDIPEEMMSAGLAGFAVIGVKALGNLDYATAEPLLAEMLAQVQIVPDPSRPMIRRALIDDDTEEVSTLLTLRREILELHVQFFTDAGLLARARNSLGAAGLLSDTPTSAAP